MKTESYSLKVLFHPFVGERFQDGLEGKKTLLLGESHYCSHEDVRRDLTQDCVKSIVDGSWSYKYWTIISRVITGKKNYEIDRETFWNSVSFYNYVQFSVGTEARVRPTPEMWQKSFEPFLEVLEKLGPDCVIVFGKELWTNLFDNLNVEERYIGEGKYSSPVASLKLNDKKCEFLGFPHPSSPRYFGKVIERHQCFKGWLKSIDYLG